MATYQAVKTLSMEAGEAFAAGSLYELLAISTATGKKGKLVKCESDNTDLGTREPAAILAQDEGKAGEYVTVIPIDGGGIAKVKANAAINAGATLVPSATAGKVDDVASAGSIAADIVVFGKALEAASAANVIISVLLGRFTAPHSA